jgi:hypothetical protein
VPRKKTVGGELVRRGIRRLEEAAGQPLELGGHKLVEPDRLEVLEAVYEDYRVMTRELDLIGYGLFDFLNNQPAEVSSTARRKIVQKARYVWANDPQAGAAVELMNDFTFGRGVPRPRAKDEKVQEVIDEFWDDPDNQEVLTTVESQLALGTDLALQSNVFLLIFEDGTDGRVKLSILRHDDVQAAVPDPEQRHRVLWYAATHQRVDWDFDLDQVKPMLPTPKPEVWYYEHYRNVEVAADDPLREEELEKPPADKTKPGKVLHLRINRGSEQIFGVPRFQRTLRWYAAYNDYVKDRLDIVKAAAAVIMKRKVKGSPGQIARDATKLISKASALTASGQLHPPGLQAGPVGAGGVMVENESAIHEPFNLDTKAGNAQQDAQMIRAPIAAAERFTQAYFGDASNSSLATATSLELPILKAVEARQEVFEQAFRTILGIVIEKAVESGRLPEVYGPDEKKKDTEPIPEQEIQQALVEACQKQVAAGRTLLEIRRVERSDGKEALWLIAAADEQGLAHFDLVEAYKDQGQDEADTNRDLNFDFSMPSPLRRMMTDLITSVTTIAQTFDPNNTNTDLSRALLTIALGEGLEVADAPDLVEEILPEGYVDPMVTAQMAAAGINPDGTPATPPASPTQGFGPQDANKPMPSGADGNAYGAPMNARTPEQLRARSGPYAATEAQHADLPPLRDRHGDVIPLPRRQLAPAPDVIDAEVIDEAGIDNMDDLTRAELSAREREVDKLFREEALAPALAALDSHHLLNGNGRG